MSEDLELCLVKLEEISKKLEPYRGQLVLIDRVKEFDPTYCDEESTPLINYTPRTITIGKLIQPLIYDPKIFKRTYREEITDTSLIGILVVSNKTQIGINCSAILPQENDMTFKNNINIYLEDLLKRTYSCNNNGMLATVTNFEVVYGNYNVKKHLEDLKEKYTIIDKELALNLEAITEMK